MNIIAFACFAAVAVMGAVAIYDNHRLSRENRRLFLQSLRAQDKCAAMAKTVTQLQQMLHGK